MLLLTTTRDITWQVKKNNASLVLKETNRYPGRPELVSWCQGEILPFSLPTGAYIRKLGCCASKKLKWCTGYRTYHDLSSLPSKKHFITTIVPISCYLPPLTNLKPHLSAIFSVCVYHSHLNTNNYLFQFVQSLPHQDYIFNVCVCDSGAISNDTWSICRVCFVFGSWEFWFLFRLRSSFSSRSFKSCLNSQESQMQNGWIFWGRFKTPLRKINIVEIHVGLYTVFTYGTVYSTFSRSLSLSVYIVHSHELCTSPKAQCGEENIGKDGQPRVVVHRIIQA